MRDSGRGMGPKVWVLLACLAGATACVHKPQGGNPPDGPDFLGEGLASFYGPGLYGHRTANGERLEPGTLTAAHRTLKFGSCVRVVNLGNGREVLVRINDRGPYAGGRILDLSVAAARQIGLQGQGVARVRLFRCSERVAQGDGERLEDAAWD